MKIGIITFHFALNCGAALQCFALESKLEELGHEVRIINYCPWYHWNRYASRKNPFYYANKVMHEPARNVFERTRKGVKGFFDTLRSWKNAEERLVRERKFTAFRKEFLRETRMYRTVRALRACPPKCDLYIAGSDQLWNSNLTDHVFDPAYFLNFGKPDVRRVTYAVGAYFADPEAARKQIAPMLGRLNEISLRETKFLDDVRQAAEQRTPIHIDVDPTLLPETEAFDSLIPRKPLQKGRFIVVYTMPGPAQKQVNDAAKRLAKKKGLRLIDVNGNPNNGNRQIADQRVVSPAEFLWYIKNAAYVLTNSFHGTVFAVLYHKRFATILHKETGNRVSELLDRLGISDHYTDSTDAVDGIVDGAVDWDGAEAALAELRAESVRYLRRQCGEAVELRYVDFKQRESAVEAGPDVRKSIADKPETEPIPKPVQTAPAPKAPEKSSETERLPVCEQIARAKQPQILYPDDKNAQIVLALLKKYGVRKIVVSPGTTNVPIARTVQFDPFFEVYSAVDERGAAYLAGGLAFATGEPVAISCTGATASRDYIPGLTEAYYRGLPVIAITSQHHSPMYSDLMPQVTDRTVSQNDVKRFAAILPVVKDDEDYRACVQLVNEALYTATRTDAGPVHINLPVGNLYGFSTPALPDVQKIDVYDAEHFPTEALRRALLHEDVALFIGSHKPFDQETREAIEDFAERLDAPVFCDQTANDTGKNRILSAVAGDLAELKSLPSLVIDLGSVSGDYSASPIFKDRRVWRISEDRRFHNRHGAETVEKLFFCTEKTFFMRMRGAENDRSYLTRVRSEIGEVRIPTLPLSNLYAASKLCSRIPKDSFLHLGILNSLRSMNYFALDPSVTVSSNVGGFGIDGALSTALGQSLADPKRLSFCLLGDLAFFYDMNALGNRHVGNNLRILLINNGRGVEFRLNARLERLWSSDTDDLIAAKGHFGSARAWAESMGFAYRRADTKEAFDAEIDGFCDPDPNHFHAPVVFEVFTDTADEQTALAHLRAYNRPMR